MTKDKMTAKGTTRWGAIAARYILAVVMVALAVVSRRWLLGNIGPMPAFITFYPAVLIVASMAGGGPGIVATLLSCLASLYWFLEPIGSFSIRYVHDAVALGIFFVMSLALCILLERSRRLQLTKAFGIAQEQELALFNMGNLVSLDLDRRIVSWSAGCGRLYGFGPQDAEGHLVDELLQTRFSQPFEQIRDELMAQNYWEGEVSRRRKDGSELALAILLAVRRDGRGKPMSILEVSTNITSQKVSETLLIESEQRFRRAIEEAPFPIMIHAEDGEILALSRAWSELSGYTLADMPTIDEWTEKAYGIHKEAVIEKIKALYALENRRSEGEYVITAQNGSQLVWDFSSVSLGRLPDGRRLAISMAADVTERKRAEEERLQLEKQLLHTQKLESLGVLAGGIAHDFNNILTSIIGNVDLALMRLKPESPAIDNLHRIEQGAVRAADLARQMLAYSGKGKFLIENININSLLEEMLHMLEVSISKKAVLRLNHTPNLPTVEADATQMRQVIMNLVINASEAIGDKSGVIAITTGCMDCDLTYLKDVWLSDNISEGLYVYLEIADTGSGMDRDTMAKIFDPFFTTKFTGRGLGMAAVLGIIRGHKGAIRVYSEPGKGTTFKILMPASGKPPAIFNHNGNHDDKGWKGKGKVLLVDDEETVRGIGREMLLELGFTAVTANDGREAVAIFRQTPDFAFVILDLTMPHMDGEQCFRELKQLRPDVKVIMSSGYNEQEVTQKFMGKGLAGFIQKPYKLSALKQVIRNI